MAALSENRLEIRGRFPGVFQEEPKSLGWGAVVGRQPVPPVIVLDQQSQQAHELGFFGGAGTALAHKIPESAVI